MRFLVMYGIVVYLVIAILSTGCTGPMERTLNVLTPDTFGVGRMDGTITGTTTQGFYPDGEIFADQEATILYVEWDLPQWKDRGLEYERYVRERQLLRQAILDAESEGINE